MKFIDTFWLYFHTIKYLKLIQIVGRLIFWLDFKKIPECTSIDLRILEGIFVPPLSTPESLIGLTEFQFINKRNISTDFDWNRCNFDKLWLYNLHYFDYLRQKNSKDIKEVLNYLLIDWVRKNSPKSSVGWEPYPTSLRIVNWVKWALVGNPLEDEIRRNLAIQAEWLYRRVEIHLLGNHIWANAKALIYAGLFFSGDKADLWLKKGLSIFENEIKRQILDDGGHVERTPMYQSLMLEDLLDLINIANAYPDKILDSAKLKWADESRKMYRWLSLMTLPDGDVSFFNDSAPNIAPSLKLLAEYAASLRVDMPYKIPLLKSGALVHLAESGYIRYEDLSISAILDVAPISADYLPGHAHADTLSFELAVDGLKILTNCGTSRYGSDKVRLAERATKSHNTVEIAGLNSSEVWGGFRVAKRAKPFDLKISKAKDDIYEVECSHDGYTRISSGLIHTRKWILSGRGVIIEDRVSGRSLPSVARFIFTKDVLIDRLDDENFYLKAQDSRIIFTVNEGRGSLEKIAYAPQFGLNMNTNCITVLLVNGRSIVKLYKEEFISNLN